MIRLLLKLRLASTFSGTGVKGKRRGGKGQLLVALLYLILGLVFSFTFAGAFLAIGTLVLQLGEGSYWFYFAITALLAGLLQVFGSVFATVTQLYQSKDNEMLLSMPIRPRDILLSRLLYLWIINFLFGLVVLLPSTVVGVGILGWGLGFYLMPLLALLLPFFSLTVSCLIGFVVSLVAKHIRRKNLATTVLYLLFFGLYMYVYTTFLSGMEEEGAMENFYAFLLPIMDNFRFAFPFSLAGFGMGGQGILWFLLFALLVLSLFLLCLWLLSRSFLHIALGGSTVGRIRYQEKKAKQRSPFGALLRRELYRFFHIPSFFINCGIGVIMLIVASVALMILRPDFSAAFAGNPGVEMLSFLMPILLSLAAAFFLAVGNPAAPAVSLEGKSLWLLRSLPVGEKQILRAEMVAQLILNGTGALFAGIAISVVTLPGLLASLALCAALLATAYFMATYSAFIGVMLPKLDWVSEVVPVKQGMAVLVSMLGGFGGMILFGAILILGIGIFPVPALWFSISALLFVGLGLLFDRLLVTKGAKKLACLVA